MAHVSYSELRNNLASYMDEVCDDLASADRGDAAECRQRRADV